MDSADHMTSSIEIAVAAIRGADPARFSARPRAAFAVHAWAVAVATGQPIEVPGRLGETVLEGALAIAPMGRERGWFAPEVEVPADAPAFVAHWPG
jgi:hypothetical protein